MATYSLLEIGRLYLVSKDGFVRAHPHDWIVYEPPSVPGETATVTTVARDNKENLLGSTNPIAIEVVKGPKPNAFPSGITIGRTENNDIVLRHQEVSRFHAYLQQQDGKMTLTDADSKNGTFVDGKQLLPLKPHPLGSEAVLRFGGLEVRYFENIHFVAWLEKRQLV